MVPPASNGVPRVPLYSGSCYVNLNFIYWTITIFGRASHHVLLFLLNRVCSPQPQMYFYFWFGLFRFRSPLLTKSIFFFLLLWVLRCFSSPRLPISTLFIHVRLTGLFLPARFPHSDSHGSMFICNSPWIIAAYRVLLRLSVPRHSPYALCSLTFILFLGSLFNFRNLVFGLIVLLCLDDSYLN